MRRFTFSGGNARKLAAIPLYALGAFASLLVSRRRGLWVFGSGTGVGEGALALLLHARSVDPRLRIVWLARNDRDRADARALGIRSAPKDGWRGFRLTLRAEVIVVTHGFGDVNRFGTHGGFVVQLWHGIPFKHIHLDSAATLRIPVLSSLPVVRGLLRRMYRRSTTGYRLFPAASALAAVRIRSAFALGKDRVVVTGDPRDDVLAQGDASDRRESARAHLARRLGAELSERVLLYAPTWRDGEPDPAVPTEESWARIARYLDESDSTLLIRSHPLGVGDYAAGARASDRIRLLGSDLVGDVTPILPAVDVLVTDYSSIAFDFSLVGGIIVFLAPDVAEYASSRGLYEPYAEFSGGSEVTTWDAALELLAAADNDPAVAARLRSHTDWLAKRSFAFRDGRNTRRVFDEIMMRLAGTITGSALGDPVGGLVIDSIAVFGEEPVLTVSGALGDERPQSVRLGGSRLRLTGTIAIDGERWIASVPLAAARWGGSRLPPPSGAYRLRISGTNGRPIALTTHVALPAPSLQAGRFRLAVTASVDTVTIDIAAPLYPGEAGADAQRRLEAEYRASRAPLENAVFFESYFGQNASCNPRGIDAALAAAQPDIVRYWSVTDASVEVPEGALPVIEGSEEWWHARASARVLVVNDWLRKRYRARRGQAVLQTWHGTPLKRIALDRSGVKPRTAVATWREKSRWDVMLAQNPFSADIFRSAYAFHGPIWQEGYPRDDVLVTGDTAAVRDRLGIPGGARVVLYAPTWRDDRPGKVDHLDVASFTRALGPDFVTLIRGHSRTMRPGTDVRADGVIDVTGYPDISELFLVADALITDYSSVMFDFSVTGKPIYFFAPDIEHYRDQLRGFYFDLIPVAPGPVLDDASELVRLLKDPESVEKDYADRYAAWRERFNPRDDGHAGERVVQRLLDEGFLG